MSWESLLLVCPCWYSTALVLVDSGRSKFFSMILGPSIPSHFLTAPQPLMSTSSRTSRQRLTSRRNVCRCRCWIARIIGVAPRWRVCVLRRTDDAKMCGRKWSCAGVPVFGDPRDLLPPTTKQFILHLWVNNSTEQLLLFHHGENDLSHPHSTQRVFLANVGAIIQQETTYLHVALQRCPH